MLIEDLSIKMQGVLQLALSDEVKVVSFDIFDTLLLRPVTHPQEVWRLVGKAAGISFFRDKRRIAEEHTRRTLHYPQEDCTLAEIYQTYSRLFSCPESEIKKLTKLEMDIERTLLYPRRAIQCIYHEIKRAGKEIILTSDMYLPSAFIIEVLEKNGYTGFAKLYLSEQEQINKNSGKLYGRVISDYNLRGIAASQILHIGDNYQTDIKNAESAGLKTAYVKRTIDSCNENPHLEAYHALSHTQLDNSFMLGLLINTLFDDPGKDFDPDSRYNGEAKLLGYTLAPFIISFLIWMVREAKRDGIEQLVFVYRDGYLPQKIYEALKNYLSEFKIIELHLSRAIRAAHYAKKPGGLYDSLCQTTFIETMSVEDFIAKRLFVREQKELDEVHSIFFRRGYLSPQAPMGRVDDFAYFLHELEPYFIRNTNEHIELCNEYVMSTLDPAKNTGIFDIGYSGSVSRFLREHLDIRSTYYCMFSTPAIDLDTAHLNRSFLKPYIANDMPTINAFQFINGSGERYSILNLFMEDVLSEPLSSAAGLSRDGTRINVLRESSYKASNTMLLIQEGVLEYIQEFVKHLGPTFHWLEFDRTGFYGILKSLLLDPREKDAQLFRDMHHFDSSFIRSKDGNYQSWHKTHFAEKKTDDYLTTRLKSKILRVGRFAAAELHMYNGARKLYGAARRLIGTSRRTKAFEEVSSQIEEGIDRLKSSSSAAPPNTVFFIGELHPAAYRMINAISRGLVDCQCIFLTTLPIQERLQCATYPIPKALGRWWVPDNPSYKQHPSLRVEGQASAYQSLVAKRFVRAAPGIKKSYAAFMAGEAYRYYTEVFKQFAPHLIVLWNKNTGVNPIVHEIAEQRSIPIVFMESGDLPGTLSIDEEGQGGRSWVAYNSSEFRALPVSNEDLAQANELIRDWRKTGANRYFQRQGEALLEPLNNLNPDQPTILFAEDYDLDTGIYPLTEYSKQFHSPIFSTSEDALYHLAGLARKNGWNIVYKRHPLLEDMPSRYPSNVVLITQGDVNKVVDKADLTITITASVSYVALIRGKPALTIGYNTLRDKRCTYEAFELAGIESAIKEALLNGQTEEQKLAFIRHVAQMNKYYLFDNLHEQLPHCGRPIEDVMLFLQGIIEREK